MGRIIAFPDMKSRLHHLSVQTGKGHDLPMHGSRDNVILFGGVFVEYHDNSQKASRVNTLRADLKRPIVASRSQSGWGTMKRTTQAENCDPEPTPRLNRR